MLQGSSPKRKERLKQYLVYLVEQGDVGIESDRPDVGLRASGARIRAVRKGGKLTLTRNPALRHGRMERFSAASNETSGAGAWIFPWVRRVKLPRNLSSSDFRRLRENGKLAKVAIVAVMRKLITTLNAMVRDNKPWSPASI